MGIDFPEIGWQGDTPYSLHYRDIYFSPVKGLEESRHVFIRGNNLENRWSDFPWPVFTILETGFGTGLNFCAAVKSYLQISTAHNVPSLQYISIEKYPLAKSDIQKALSAFPEIKDQSEELLNQYPLRMIGTHRIHLKNRIMLTLIFNDNLVALRQLLSGIQVDACFLDGFNPSHNAEMWSEEFFSEVKKHSGAETTVATFTAAGHVRRKLQAHGFTVTKVPGFGNKREMITGVCTGAAVSRQKPWFYRNVEKQGKKKSGKKAAILGAGLSGCAAADAFAKRNWQVDLIDRNAEICSEASGNSLGIFFPVIHRKPTYTSRFSGLCYNYLIRHLNELQRDGFGDLLLLQNSGLLQILKSADDSDRFEGREYRDSSSLDPLYNLLTGSDLKNNYNLNSIGGSFFKHAGSLSPSGLSRANLKRHENTNPVNTLLAHNVSNLVFNNGRWIVLDSAGRTISEADVLVLANSWAIDNFSQTNWLKLQKVRGQMFASAAMISDFSVPVVSGTYMIPYPQGIIVGATHDRIDEETEQPGQNEELLESCYQFYPELKNKIDKNPQLISRVSFRSAAEDHFPVMGALPDYEKYREIFNDLKNGDTGYIRKHGDDDRPEAWYENLYCITGCGSRGILYSQLGGEIIAALANRDSGEAVPMEKDILEALSPARFLYRALKRKK